MSEHFIINPLTNRRIQIGGPSHRRLIKQGVLPPVNARPAPLAPSAPSAHSEPEREPNNERLIPEAKEMKEEEKKDERLIPLEEKKEPEIKEDAIMGVEIKEEPIPETKEEKWEPETLTSEKKDESDEDDFFFDKPYLNYKKALEKNKMEEFVDKYKFLSIEELKLMIEIMSDEIVSKSIDTHD